MPRSLASTISVWLCHWIPTLATPFAAYSSTRYNGSNLSVEAWHARSLTNVSWQLPTGSASAQDRVIIFWDTLATGLLRFGNIMNETSISVTSSLTTLHTVFPEEMGAGSDICNYTAYETDQRNAFHSESLSGESTVDLEDSLAWWYTSSLAQEVDGAETSDQGESLVLLSDPGVYFVCLLLGNDSCEATECLELMVYQPPYDFMEVDSTNIGALVTIRFNLVSQDANIGDWGWMLGGVDPSFSVADANALTSGEVYSTFEEGCWFYFGKAVVLGRPFLCSRDPDTQLASLQASTADRVYQYGFLELYTSAVRNVSLWYAVDEDYSYSMIHNFYICGIDVRYPASLETNTTEDVVIVGRLDQGEDCAVGAGIPLKIRTIGVTFHYVDIEASIFFWGQMEGMNSTETELSIRLPVQGIHTIVIELESGAILDMLNVTAVAAEPYASACTVNEAPPHLMSVHSSFDVSFLSRDFYNNDITIGYGDDAFNAWVYQTTGENRPTPVYDNQDGSYSVRMQTDNTTGTVFLFIQRHRLNIPGSPFEIYVFGPDQCVIEFLDIRVDECKAHLSRNVVHEWKEGVECDGGLTLPEDTQVECSYIPANSTLGRAMVGSSVFAALYSAMYLVWIQKHRKCVVVKLGQPFVCKLFLVGCVLLNLTGPLHLGQPTRLRCMARPFLLHITLTFTSSCLYMKTYRVHRLFNNPTLTRLSITDRSLVIWVLRLVAVDVIVLSIWMLVDGPSVATHQEVVGYAEFDSPVCDPGAQYFSMLLWIYKGGLNLFGVTMAAKTWKCADGVGESHSICLSVYNMTLLGIVCVVLHVLVGDNTVAASSSQSFAAVCGTVFTVSAVFGPKVYKLHYLGDMVGRPVCNTTTKSGRSSTTRLRSTADISLPSSLAQPLDSTSKDTRRHPYKMHRDSRINPLEATPTGSPTPPPKRPGVLPPIEKQSRRPSAMPLLRSNP